MNLTNVNGNLMNPESTVGRSTQLRGVIFALLLKATHATNSSSTEADSESDFPFMTSDAVAGGALLFGLCACALLRCISNCLNSDDSDNLVSQGWRSDQSRTRRPCNNGENNGSSIEAASRSVDVLDAEFVQAIPFNTDDIQVARRLENIL